AVLEEVAEGPLPYRRANDLPFGTAWNVPADYMSRDGRDTPLTSLGAHLTDRAGIGTHAVLEFPYADAEGVEVDARSARAFGAVATLRCSRSTRTLRMVPVTERMRCSNSPMHTPKGSRSMRAVPVPSARTSPGRSPCTLQNATSVTGERSNHRPCPAGRQVPRSHLVPRREPHRAAR